MTWLAAALTVLFVVLTVYYGRQIPGQRAGGSPDVRRTVRSTVLSALAAVVWAAIFVLYAW